VMYVDGYKLTSKRGETLTTDLYSAVGWNPLAAENVDGKNYLVWAHDTTGGMLRWDMNDVWQQRNSVGFDNGTSDFFAAELTFNVDANNDGVIGTLSTTALATDTGNVIVQVATDTNVMYVGGTQLLSKRGDVLSTDIYAGVGWRSRQRPSGAQITLSGHMKPQRESFVGK
jgi:hypothetical protein